MSGVDEHLGVGEQVLTVLRKEGEDMKPDDMQCEAKKGKGRCKKDKSFDEVTDTWLRWCSDHAEKEAKARTEGGPRVVRA